MPTPQDKEPGKEEMLLQQLSGLLKSLGNAECSIAGKAPI